MAKDRATNQAGAARTYTAERRIAAARKGGQARWAKARGQATGTDPAGIPDAGVAANGVAVVPVVAAPAVVADVVPPASSDRHAAIAAELAAMRAVADALSGLDDATVVRVIEWVVGRFGPGE
jgi:hypothetical protein